MPGFFIEGKGSIDLPHRSPEEFRENIGIHIVIYQSACIIVFKLFSQHSLIRSYSLLIIHYVDFLSQLLRFKRLNRGC